LVRYIVAKASRDFYEKIRRKVVKAPKAIGKMRMKAGSAG
jgi:hypothetical protein